MFQVVPGFNPRITGEIFDKRPASFCSIAIRKIEPKNQDFSNRKSAGTEINFLNLDRFELADARRQGFEIADFSIHFEGYCPECRRKKTKALSPRAGLRREK